MKNYEFQFFLDSSGIRRIQAFCSSYLRSHKIHLYEYVRVYDDGSFLIFSNSEAVIEYLLQKEVVLPPVLGKASKNAPQKLWYINEPSGPYSDAIQFFSQRLNANNCADLIRRFKGYTELSCFGSQYSYEQSVNHYLNHQTELEDFSNLFAREMQKEISEKEKIKFKLPENMYALSRQNYKVDDVVIPIQKSVAPEVLLESRIIALLNSYHLAEFSKQEKECLKCLFMGKSAKETADELGLSSRTVEHYLENIKNKLNCNRKSEIITHLLMSR
jgi:DNA-binding CsgD family transcriptional regulator